MGRTTRTTDAGVKPGMGTGWQLRKQVRSCLCGPGQTAKNQADSHFKKPLYDALKETILQARSSLNKEDYQKLPFIRFALNKH